MSLRKALVRKEGQLHLQNGGAVLDELKSLVSGEESTNNTDITTNHILIKKIQQMRDMESKLPEAEY